MSARDGLPLGIGGGPRPREIRGSRNLDVACIAGHEPDGMPGALDQPRLVARLQHRRAALDRGSQDVPPEPLRCLGEKDPLPLEGTLDDRPIALPARLLHRVVHRDGGNRGAGLPCRVDGAIDQSGFDEGPRRVVHEDDVGGP